MERSDGYGSPVAFLIGVIGEGLFPAIPAVMLLSIAIFHGNPKKTQPVEMANTRVAD